ncbi:MAG: ester cyclase [Candidatus Aminicenantes bacterium]|jgi:steroid delta-isomerase-like uncharacterized protein
MKKQFMLMPLVLLVCLVVGCQDKEALAELEEFKAQAEVEEQNEALYRGIIDEINKGSSEYFNEFYSPDSLYYFPSNNPKPLSREESQEFVKGFFQAFPDLNFSIEELHAVEDRVIARLILRGTHEGDWRGIPATGNKFEMSSTFIIRIENGKVVEEREDFDQLGFLQQLGWELKLKEEK